ncbi:MAG: radical SAM protein [Methanoregulaceae archaeon]|nr:radical SAM protein [Methanoregulaceae archaeon]
MIDDEYICLFGKDRAGPGPVTVDISTIFYEISGSCNGGCRYCSTGGGSFDGCRWRYLPPGEFDRGIERLTDLGFLRDRVYLGLYSWGEPFLNPRIDEILLNLHKRGQSYALSTNGSKYLPLPEKYFETLQHIRFSLHGFSQKSFQRINRLSFEAVRGNIDKWLDILPSGAVEICFFLYRFNYEDLLSAHDYFSDRGVSFHVNMPFIADFFSSIGYVTGNLDEQTRAAVDRDIETDHILDLLKTKPDGYICPHQTSQLALDEFSNVLTCCAISKKSAFYTIGSLFDLSRDEIIQAKKNVPLCSGCTKIGTPYWKTHARELLPVFIGQNFTR